MIDLEHTDVGKFVQRCIDNVCKRIVHLKQLLIQTNPALALPPQCHASAAPPKIPGHRQFANSTAAMLFNECVGDRQAVGQDPRDGGACDRIERLTLA